MMFNEPYLVLCPHACLLVSLPSRAICRRISYARRSSGFTRGHVSWRGRGDRAAHAIDELAEPSGSEDLPQPLPPPLAPLLQPPHLAPLLQLPHLAPLLQLPELQRDGAENP